VSGGRPSAIGPSLVAHLNAALNLVLESPSAAFWSPSASPLYGSLGARFWSYRPFQKVATPTPSGGVEVWFVVVDQAFAAGLGDQELVIVKAGLIEPRGRAGPDRSLNTALVDECLGRLLEFGIRLEGRVISRDTGLGEDGLVVG
jgi:hypothetical protein